MEFKELLPLGSVIQLPGALKKLMIIGYKVAHKDKPEEFFDYIGVLFPEGFIGQQTVLFNHAEINDVIFTGYENPEREYFMDFLDDHVDELMNSEFKQSEDSEPFKKD